ncbi:MAG: MoaD/ThiS family protein [Synechococcaceae bacterium WB9_2_112]|nr:MoaD/ThiS family protein [Synechococcaceae bacterium WB9_2_112]
MGEPSVDGIRILLFAGLREQAGWGDRHWPAPAATATTLTPRQLWQALELPGTMSSMRIAINQQFAEPDTPVHPGDELAFLPPTSGG